LRGRRELPVVALVGYTNVGKSTLLNALTRADAYAADLPFATLDPLTRRLTLPAGREVLVSDTVGLISKLPTTVVAAFRATLEELNEADILVHVVDLSHPNAPEQNATVHRLIGELGLAGKPIITAVNKIDALLPADATALPPVAELSLPPLPNLVVVSALRGWGLDALQSAIEDALAEPMSDVEVTIPYDQGQLVDLFRRRGRVLKEDHTREGTVLRGQLPPSIRSAFAPYLRSRRAASRARSR
jgi:GTP-binding protein HflX